MKGTNKLTFNMASMTVVIQHFFDNVLFRDGQSPLVTGVCFEGIIGGFEVSVTDKPEAGCEPN